MWTLVLVLLLGGSPINEVQVVEIPSKEQCESLRADTGKLTEIMIEKTGLADIKVMAMECKEDGPGKGESKL